MYKSYVLFVGSLVDLDSFFSLSLLFSLHFHFMYFFLLHISFLTSIPYFSVVLRLAKFDNGSWLLSKDYAHTHTYIHSHSFVSIGLYIYDVDFLVFSFSFPHFISLNPIIFYFVFNFFRHFSIEHLSRF